MFLLHYLSGEQLKDLLEGLQKISKEKGVPSAENLMLFLGIMATAPVIPELLKVIRSNIDSLETANEEPKDSQLHKYADKGRAIVAKHLSSLPKEDR